MVRSHALVCPVHPKIEALFQKLLDRIEHPLSGTLRFDIDICIVCVAAEPVPSPFELLVQFVKQEITEDWRQGSAL